MTDQSRTRLFVTTGIFVKDEDEETTVALLKDPADEGTPSPVGSNEYMSLVSDTPPPRPQSRREFCDGASLVSR